MCFKLYTWRSKKIIVIARELLYHEICCMERLKTQIYYFSWVVGSWDFFTDFVLQKVSVCLSLIKDYSTKLDSRHRHRKQTNRPDRPETLLYY